MGNYHLKSEFRRAFIPPSDMILPKKIVCPDDVIEYLKNVKPLSLENNLQDDTSETSKIIKQTDEHAEITTELGVKNDSPLITDDIIVEKTPMVELPVFNSDCSQQSLARFIVDNNLITLVPQEGAFIVQGRIL